MKLLIVLVLLGLILLKAEEETLHPSGVDFTSSMPEVKSFLDDSEVDISGRTSFWYQTTAKENTKHANTNLFDKNSASGDFAAVLGADVNYSRHISFGIEGTYVSMLGLNNVLMVNPWLTTNTSDNYWLSEAYIAGTYEENTLEVGRMYIHTPLIFSQYSIVANTFGAWAYKNTMLEDTSLLFLYFAASNGAQTKIVANADNGINPFSSFTAYNTSLYLIGDINASEGLGGQGAYCAGFMNNSYHNLHSQGWYYDIRNVMRAYWLQADYDDGSVVAGAQFTQMFPSNHLDFDNASSAYALKLGYRYGKLLYGEAAFSQTANNGVFNVQNLANANMSDLYTEDYWWWTVVGTPGTTGYKLLFSGEVPIDGKFSWFFMNNLYSTNTEVVYSRSKNRILDGNQGGTLWEMTIGVSKRFFENFNVTIAYSRDDFRVRNAEGQTSVIGVSENMTANVLQFYLDLYL